jgi:hypothetical protein
MTSSSVSSVVGFCSLQRRETFSLFDFQEITEKYMHVIEQYSEKPVSRASDYSSRFNPTTIKIMQIQGMSVLPSSIKPANGLQLSVTCLSFHRL